MKIRIYRFEACAEGPTFEDFLVLIGDGNFMRLRVGLVLLVLLRVDLDIFGALFGVKLLLVDI